MREFVAVVEKLRNAVFQVSSVVLKSSGGAPRICPCLDDCGGPWTRTLVDKRLGFPEIAGWYGIGDVENYSALIDKTAEVVWIKPLDDLLVDKSLDFKIVTVARVVGNGIGTLTFQILEEGR